MKQSRVSVLGLTGSIASGKSTVSAVFRDEGYLIVDCDEVARKLTEKAVIVSKIAEVFGEGVLLSNGKIDRKKLGGIVFSDSREKTKLDEVLKFPLRKDILDAMRGAVLSSKKDFVVLDCPLLFESGLDAVCDVTLSIWVDRDIQIERLIKRNKIEEKLAMQMISSQLSSSEKAKRADYVIDNNSDIKTLKAEVHRFIGEVLHGLVL